jgi:diaminohydroxyphosphoribosylaminopyrimidine deaminase/5-amino-6-(5-phosphoribosylamino)uracil reductase
VRGRGVARLRQAGIDVTVGIGAAEAAKLNEFYVHHRHTGRPFVALKWAMTVDGRMVTEPDEPRWITGPQARRHVHELRHRYDAILVGAGTVLADDPRLTTRLEDRPDARNPVRVVLDRRLRTPVTAAVLPALIFTAPDAPPDARARLEASGAEVAAVGTDPAAVLEELGRRGILSVLVEGGPAIHRSFAEHADRVLAYVASGLAGRVALDALSARQYGDDMLLEGDVHRDHQ